MLEVGENFVVLNMVQNVPANNVFKKFTSNTSQRKTPSLKRAAIVPIFKSGDKCLPGNYRPISLTSVICKVYERIIRKQVFYFLCDKNCLNDTQHGFRSGRSCLSALLDVYDDVMHMLNRVSIVDMVYLDFAKAFDKVDHGILLHKVKDLGITGKLGQSNTSTIGGTKNILQILSHLYVNSVILTLDFSPMRGLIACD